MRYRSCIPPSICRVYCADKKTNSVLHEHDSAIPGTSYCAAHTKPATNACLLPRQRCPVPELPYGRMAVNRKLRRPLGPGRVGVAEALLALRFQQPLRWEGGAAVGQAQCGQAWSDETQCKAALSCTTGNRCKGNCTPGNQCKVKCTTCHRCQVNCKTGYQHTSCTLAAAPHV